MTSFYGRTLTWSGRRLATFSYNGTTASYTYNSDGIRTSKTVNGTKTEFFLNGTQILAQKTGSNMPMVFYYDHNGKRVAFKNTDGAVYFYVYNLQGDVVQLLDSSRNIVGEYQYDPYGRVQNTLSAIAKANPFRYRGYYYDTENGYYYLNARYYYPVFGRFISADDTTNLGTDGDISGYNLFSYCQNNPINRVDKTGCASLPNWAAIAIGGAVITGLAVATACTGGIAGVILGAALTGALYGGFGGAAVGAVLGGVMGGMQGAVDGACSGFLDGTILGGATGAVLSGMAYATGAVDIIGSAQKTGTIFHRAASNIEAGKMAMNPIKYSEVYLNRSLNTAGLSGRKIPDVIGVARSGCCRLIEVVSKSQTYNQMQAKCALMERTNPGTTSKVIGWAAKVSRLFK